MKISYHISALTAICVLLTSTVFAQEAQIAIDQKDFSPICLVANVTANGKFLTVNFNKQSEIQVGSIGKNKRLLSRFQTPIGSGDVKLSKPHAAIFESLSNPDVMFYVVSKNCKFSPGKAICKIQKLQAAHLAKHAKQAKKVKSVKTIKNMPVCIYGQLQ